MPFQTTLKNAIISGALLSMAHGMSVNAGEDKITKGYNSMDAMGCMLLRECKKDVNEVYSLLDISSQYPNTEEFTPIAYEFNTMLMAMNQVGIKVFLADQRYFPIMHRGVYHTMSNNVYLNKRYMGEPHILMQLMRHEGWHAAQDCMAGTIENSLIAIIKPEEDVPQYWQNVVKKTYAGSPALIWEKEAFWAGHTEGMTLNALRACALPKPMWETYKPTPLTGKYLIDYGFIKE